MATGTRLLSALIGPVNIWNTTKRIPAPEIIAGTYQIAGETKDSLHRRGIFVSYQSGFTLNADHTLIVTDLPAFDDRGEPRDCNYNGVGTWSLYDTSTNINLVMDAKAISAPPGNVPACGIENAGLMTLLGHSSPYRFWYVIGDPDEETGLLYRRR